MNTFKKIFSYLNIINCLFWTLVSATYGAQTALAQSFETAQPSHCDYTIAEGVAPKYDYEFLGSRKALAIQPHELTKVIVYVRNSGTIPFFSEDSGCSFRPITRLGTANSRDRGSALFTTVHDDEENGWISESRVKLDQLRLNPGEKGSFTFWIKAPETKGIYLEYFDVLIEGKSWLNKPFQLSFDVGEFTTEHREYLAYIQKSRYVSPDELSNQKAIEVDISAQRMILKIGDTVVKNFPVSTGTYRTPTPYGHTIVSHKQDVRVARKWPHYIMPQWMTFRSGGYGIHALPSLSFDNGYFWTEALNHIGTRRSHGCIRLLPQDALYAYGFAEIGTPVWVHQ